MFCTNCGKEIDDKAAVCTHCGVPVKKANKSSKTWVIVPVMIIILFVIAIIGLDENNGSVAESKNVSKESSQKRSRLLNLVEDGVAGMVADNEIKKFEIANRNGDKMTACLSAGVVKAAFLEAKNEAEFKKWRDIEKKTCRAVGVDF